MSIGMGTPLLLVGASAGKLLPSAGAWMDTVKNLFGVMFLGVAAWMLARIVPGCGQHGHLGGAARSCSPGCCGVRSEVRGRQGLSRALAVVAGVYGVVLLAGAASAAPIRWRRIPQLAAKQTSLDFKRFKTVADLEREVAAALRPPARP